MLPNLPFEENVEITKRVVEYAHSKGVVVEAELGRLAGIEDAVSVSERDATLRFPNKLQNLLKERELIHWLLPSAQATAPSNLKGTFIRF